MGREAIRDALDALIASALPQADRRGFSGKPGKPERLTSSGAVVLLSVDAGDAEIDLNPVTYHYEAEFDLAFLAATIGSAETMMAAFGSALAADRTLGGTCEWADATGGGLDEETMVGSDGHTEARCTVTAAYSTLNPLD